MSLVTPFQWTLAAVGLLICAACTGAILWSLYALLMGHTTTSGIMSRLPEWAVALFCLCVGATIGFVLGHWFWPLAE